MPTLIDTPKGIDSNSYASVAAAAIYFDERLDSSPWEDASADDRVRALIMATRRLDIEQFEGVKTTVEQALKWPRFGADDADENPFDADFIPVIVRQATFEQALELLRMAASGTEIGGLTGLEGFERVKVGPIEVEPRSPLPLAGIALTADVLRLLAPVLLVSGNINVRLTRTAARQPLGPWWAF